MERLVDLHVHLDGSLSLETVKELAARQGIEIQNDDILIKKLQVSKDCRDLNEYLTKFEYPLMLLQTIDSVEYAVYSLMKRQSEQNLLYSEIRFAPQLHTKKGLSQEEVVTASLKGRQKYFDELRQKENIKEGDIPSFYSNIILCCMRGNGNERENEETIRIAAEFLSDSDGVVAVDLAGAEALFPTSDYEKLFAHARAEGIPFTIHAGEAAGPESIRQAVDYGTARIGHGVNCIHDKNLMNIIAEKGITLELCPTSNLNTKIVNDIKDYPIDKIINNKIKVTINTDNMTVSGTDEASEMKLICDTFGYDGNMRRIFVNNAIDAAFLSDEMKEKLRGNL